MIKRNLESQIKKYAGQYPVLSIVGPRQSGKTTLARYMSLGTGKFFFNLDKKLHVVQVGRDFPQCC